MKLLILVLALATTTKLMADEITLSSDLWCPYACDDKASMPGFMVEIAKAVFEPAGHKVVYKTVNWARAVEETRDGKYLGIVGAAKGDVPGFIFPSIPIGHSSNFYWTNKDSNWNYKNATSVSGKKIAVINAYSYGDEIDSLVAKKDPAFVIVSGNDALIKMVKMLKAKRIDAFVENPNVLSFNLKGKMDMSDFKTVSKNVANDPDLFIAFSPAQPKAKEYARILSEGMAKIRKNGKLKLILQKYGVSDWVK